LTVFRHPIRAIALATLALLISSTGSDRTFAAEPEQVTPQGEDPPGADNGAIDIPAPSEHEGVIAPPPVGDEEIHTDAPNPDAGTDEEVIRPPETSGTDIDPRH
jgi:hypothetical protein